MSPALTSPLSLRTVNHTAHWTSFDPSYCTAQRLLTLSAQHQTHEPIWSSSTASCSVTLFTTIHYPAQQLRIFFDKPFLLMLLVASPISFTSQISLKTSQYSPPFPQPSWAKPGHRLPALLNCPPNTLASLFLLPLPIHSADTMMLLRCFILLPLL